MRRSWVSVAAIAAVFAALFANTAVAQADTKHQSLELINAARAEYGAKPVTWDAGGYAATLKYAQACKFEHSDAQGRYGENLYAGAGGKDAIAEAIDAWMREAADYDYNKPGFAMDTGHFTQVVWKSSTAVSVAVADCPAGSIFDVASKYVVARFTPTGNFTGRFPENVGKRQG